MTGYLSERWGGLERGGLKSRTTTTKSWTLQVDTPIKTFSEFCILSRHLDRFCSSKRPRGPRGAQGIPNDKKTAAPRLLDRLLFRYPPPQIRLKWTFYPLLSTVNFNGKIDFSTHGYPMTSKGRLLGFPNHPYFLKFMKMARCGVPLK